MSVCSILYIIFLLLLFSAKSCPAFSNPMDCSTPGFPVLHYLPDLLKLMSIESVMSSYHLILCCSLLLLPSVFPSIRVFSSESALRIRGPKYWRFSVSPSNEYSGLISFRIDWFDNSLLFKGLSRVFSAPQFKSINSLALSLLYGSTLTQIHT